MVCSSTVCHFTIPLLHHLSFPFRPYLHVYAQSNEVEEIAVINLDGTNVDSDPQKELLLGVHNLLLLIVVIGSDLFV